MKLNDIEQALGGDHWVEPSTDFAARVMTAVRRHAQERDALAFPWRRLVPGLTACSAVAVAGLVLGPAPAVPDALVSTLNDPAVVEALTWIPTSLAGIWALVWMSLRWCQVE